MTIHRTSGRSQVKKNGRVILNHRHTSQLGTFQNRKDWWESGVADQLGKKEGNFPLQHQVMMQCAPFSTRHLANSQSRLERTLIIAIMATCLCGVRLMPCSVAFFKVCGHSNIEQWIREDCTPREMSTSTHAQLRSSLLWILHALQST